MEVLAKMVGDDVTPAEIAATMGRSESAVTGKAERLKDSERKRRRSKRPRLLAPIAKAKRKCLNCRSTFKSEGIGNRICDICKENNRALGHLEGVAK